MYLIFLWKSVWFGTTLIGFRIIKYLQSQLHYQNIFRNYYAQLAN
jgi:hypothetical protein